jgi:ferredoxin--NADP+ reductase
MNTRIGTEERPLRVAIIGAGPSGFYAAQALLEQSEYQVAVDVFDHLPAPYGLVRYGVAPDHQKIKGVTKVYDRIAEDPRFRFFGNVTFGQDITHDDVLKHYDMVVYAVGAQSDRRLNVPGEDLERSLPATQFVAWYNAHPDYSHLTFDLSIDKVAVIGVGNVAMDVARILALSPDELARTDIADYALEALRRSNVRDIYIIARRGPAQVKFTNPELRELAELEVTDIIIDPDQLKLDPHSEAAIADNREAQTNLEIMRHYAMLGDTGKPKRIHFLFLRSPVEIIGDDQGRVVRMKLEKNILKPTETGYLASHGTGEYEWLDVGMVVRAIGYRGQPLPGVPFHERWGVISNKDGRVTVYETGEIVPREYVVGWAKRGATGVIGTNKPDAAATVRLMLEDVPHITPAADEDADPDAIVHLLEARGIRYVSWQDWKLIDAAEVEAGRRQGRPRVKFPTVQAMFAALRQAIEALTRDVLIIGAGPAGLYAAFYAGFRKLRAKVLEALPLVGGQMATLYPQVDVQDLPGFMKIEAAEFVRRLRDQALQFGDDVQILVNRRVRSIVREEDVFLVKDHRGETHRGRRLILATGAGAMRPNRMDNP